MNILNNTNTKNQDKLKMKTPEENCEAKIQAKENGKL